MKYKIIEILRVFSKKDLKDFDLFLNSPFFNESQKIRRLYKILIRYYPDFNSANLTEEKLSKELNANLAFNKSTFKSLLFEMANLAEEYFKIININSREIEAEDFLRDELLKRKLFKYFESNIEKSEKIMNDMKEEKSKYFFNLFRLFTDKYNSLMGNKPKSNKNFFSQGISILSDRSFFLSIAFIKEIWSQYNIIMNMKASYDVDEENNFVINLFKVINFEEVLLFLISASPNKDYTVILNLNLLLYRAFAGYNNEEKYFNYKKYLLKNVHFLGIDEITFHFSRLIAYCQMKRRDGNTSIDFRSELFSVYKYMLHKEYYKGGLNLYIPVELFRIILKLGFEMKKYVWTLNFIKKYCKKLHPERRMNMYHYSLAEYYFYRKRFDLALKNFHKVILDHFMLKVDIKCLMLMTYYELGLYENAISLVDTFKHFLTNDKTLTDEYKKKIKSFIIVIYKMIKYRISFKSDIKEYYNKNKNQSLLYKDWLNEKFLELDKEYTKSA